MNSGTTVTEKPRHLYLVVTPRTVQRDDHDMVACACRGSNPDCTWCVGSGAVARNVAETLGWIHETNDRSIGADLRRSLLAVVDGGKVA